MNKTVQNKLFDRFGELFSDCSVSDELECGDGWYQLLYDTFQEIEQTGEQCAITQVKEKFGQLRLYAKASEDVQAILEQAEAKSGTVCDVCGDAGRIQYINEYVVATRCNNHNNDNY